MLQPDSLFRLLFPSDPQLSPDGRAVAFVLTRIEEEDPRLPDGKPRYKSAVHFSDGGPARPLTSGEKRDTSPRFSPDGASIVFLSDRSGANQLYHLPLAGGEARRLTHLKAGAANPKWSPDGTRVAFLSRGDWQDTARERGEARAVTRLVDKFNGLGFLPPFPASLWIVDVATGEARELHRPAASITDFVWRPDGSGLIYSGAPDERAAAFWENELFALDLDGNATVLTAWRSTLGGLALHPDGRRLVAVGRPTGEPNFKDPHLFAFDLGAEAPIPGVRIDGDVDVPVGCLLSGDAHVGVAATGAPPQWVGDALLAPYTVGGSCGVFEVRDGGHAPRAHDAGRVIAQFSANAHGLAHLSESEADPPEVVLNGERVTDCAAALGDFPRRRAERVSFRNADGDEVEGWVLRPEGENVPALLSIHGGPHTAYGHVFMHEFQLLAARGYAVCYSNPRGSVGYGQAFTEAIRGRWGTVDADDLLGFFDACLERFPDLDRSRTGVMGGSYGGVMTNWLIGHSDRFRAAVTDRCICNYVSFSGTADIGARFLDDELGLDVTRAEDAQKLWDLSPLKFVENVVTPCLVVHSEEDHRCPIEQAEQWFTALLKRGVETRLVRFPGETHELSRSGRPDRRARRLEEYLAWLDAHLAAPGNSAG